MKKAKRVFTSMFSGAVPLLFGMFLTFSVATLPALPVAAVDCNGVNISIDVGCKADENPIYSYSKAIMRVLSVLVGVVVVGAIIVGGIMYSSARDDKGQAEKAIEVIRNAVIGLLLYIGMAAILNFIVPGGLFS